MKSTEILNKGKALNLRLTRQTFKLENPPIASTESSELKGKQPRWCHLVMSKPRESLLTAPTLRASFAMAEEHFLQEERPDLAYSTAVFVGGAIAGPLEQEDEERGPWA